MCYLPCRAFIGVDIVVMSGDVVCCSVVGVSLFTIMCSELLIMSEITTSMIIGV